MSVDKRIFVRNIPPDTNEDDVKSFFKKLGQIKDVKIGAKATGSFAFFTVQCQKDAPPKDFRKYKNWKGSKIDVELAKSESFLERLKRERLESSTQPPSKSIESPDILKSKSKLVTSNLIEKFSLREKSVPDVSRKKRKRKRSTSSEKEITIPKFGGTSMLQDSMNNDKTENSLFVDSDDDDEKEKINKNLLKELLKGGSEEIESCADVKKKGKRIKQDERCTVDGNEHTRENRMATSRWPWLPPKMMQNGNELKEILGDDIKEEKKRPKRVKSKENSKEKAVPSSKQEKKMRDDERRRQSIIDKTAIKRQQLNVIKSALSSAEKKSNRIVFDDNYYKDSPSERKTLSLFNDDDDGDINGYVDDFGLEKNEKLMKLQARVGADERFRVDEKFLEDASVGEETDKPSHKKGPLEMVRFDPSHSQTTTPADENKETKKAPPPTAEKTSKSEEKYYEVSDSIITSLKEGAKGFSLLATYGGAPTEVQRERYPSERMMKAKAVLKRNPLMDVSSDEESVVENDDKNPAPWRPEISVPLSVSSDCFFLKDDDPIFKDAIEFINKKNSEEANQAAEKYPETRRILKRLFKEQHSRRIKQASKKMVGGIKKLPPRKNNYQSNNVRTFKIKKI